VTDVKSTRRQRSQATRRKITHAAEAEFLDKGFHGATIASIAERAGVAQQTVYFVFHNKAALISAVIDNAVLGEDAPTVPQRADWWAAARAEPRADAALRSIIRGAGDIFARSSGISEIMRAAALTDDEVRRTLDYHENLRYEGFREVIEMLAAKGKLKKGLDVSTATDVLMTIYGDSTYHLLTTERGWSHDQVIDWLCAALPELLLGNEVGPSAKNDSARA
jgi:AcrR family transcriptional regulator